MRTKPTRTPSGAIAVRQPSVNGWDISYNPDDGRWYVARTVRNDELEFVANYAERRNALAYARKHQPQHGKAANIDTDGLLDKLDEEQ